MGGTGGGHYVSYARHHITGKWYYFDDAMEVVEVPESEVVQSEAYVLFYSRRTHLTRKKTLIEDVNAAGTSVCHALGVVCALYDIGADPILCLTL